MMTILRIRVVTGAKKTAFEGWVGEAVKIKLHAQPVDNKANDALIAFLAEQFKVNKRSVKILSGEKSKEKIVEILNSEENPFPKIVL